MVRQTARVVIFEILGGLLFLAVVAAALFAWRLSQGPLELAAYTDDIERALSDARGGRDVSIEQVQLEWSPQRRRVDVTAQGVTFFASTGEVAGTAERAAIELDASALLLGQADILAIELRGGFVEVRQISSDVWQVAGEPLPPIPASAPPQTPAEWISAINRVGAAIHQGGPGGVSLIQLSEVAFEDIRLDIVLANGETVAKLVGLDGMVAVADGDFSLTMAGEGASEGLPENLSVSLQSTGAFEDLRVDLALSGWTLSELARRLGADEARFSGLPSGLVLTLMSDRAIGLERAELRAALGAGAFRLGEQTIPVTQVDADLAYEMATDVFSFDFTTLDAGPLRGVLSGQVERAIAPGDTGRPIVLRSESLRVDATPRFQRTFPLIGLEVDATVTGDLARAEISRARFQSGPATFLASGDIERTQDQLPGELPFSVRGAADVRGEIGTRTILDFWPVKLGDGARRFVARNIEDATLLGATARVDIRPDSMAAGHLADEALEVDFSVRDATVRFLSDMPPVTNAAGTGRLTGNSFAVSVARGRWSGWTLGSGRVAIPALNPRGGDMLIEVSGRGPLASALPPIFRSRLRLEEQSGFNPDRVSGEGEVTFTMRRPALENVPAEDIEVTVTGQVRNASVTQLAAGFDLVNTTGRVDLTRERIAITGFGDLGPATVNFEWRDDFNDNGGPSRVSARSVVTPDVLNRFGLLGRPYVSGEVPVEVEAYLSGDHVARSTINLDFTDARIDLLEIGWRKPPGDPATAVINYTEQGGVRTADADLVSETLRLAGRVQLGEDGRLLNADLDRAFLAGRVDVGGQVRRGPQGGLEVSVSGPLLDVSAALPSTSGVSDGGGFSSAITLDAEVDRLVVGDTLSLRQARMAAISTIEGLQTFSASGALAAGGDLEATYTNTGGGTAQLGLVSDDAGALIATFFGSEILVGGALTLDGVLRPAGQATDYNIRIEDARLLDAPFLTQILSLASLRGLADTLGGEGVLFSDINIPLRTLDGRYVVKGGRASGPALGLTANGWVELEEGGIAVDGVLVPSFGVNSALGGVPIIGDLFVGRDGEGVFSLTYSVRGDLAKAQIAVNPLSAITPGVLRRIFENPSDTELPMPDAPESESGE